MENKELTWWGFLLTTLKVITMLAWWPLTLIYLTIKVLDND